MWKETCDYKALPQMSPVLMLGVDLGIQAICETNKRNLPCIKSLIFLMKPVNL